MVVRRYQSCLTVIPSYEINSLCPVMFHLLYLTILLCVSYNIKFNSLFSFWNSHFFGSYSVYIPVIESVEFCQNILRSFDTIIEILHFWDMESELDMVWWWNIEIGSSEFYCKNCFKVLLCRCWKSSTLPCIVGWEWLEVDSFHNISIKISLTTFVVTAFQQHLYLCVSLTMLVQLSGKPCNRSHSTGVSRLIPLTWLLCSHAFLVRVGAINFFPPSLYQWGVCWMKGCLFHHCMVFRVGLSQSDPYTLSFECFGWLSCWIWLHVQFQYRERSVLTIWGRWDELHVLFSLMRAASY